MPWNETLYERPLRKPLDDETRSAISALYQERRHEIPLPTEFTWHAAEPRFTIKSRWLSFVGRFTAEKLVVVAELSLAAKMMATDENRGLAVRFIEGIANDLGL